MDSVFDRYFKEYDAWYEKNRFAYLSEIEAIREIMPPEGKGLEIGVGSGRFASVLGVGFGIDPSRNLIEIACERGIEVEVARGENLPFPDNKFDYVLIIITLCFVKNPRKVIAEARRVLEKRGKIIIGIIDKDSFLGKIYQAKRSKFYKSARFFSVNEAVDLLKQAHFSGISFKQTIFHLPSKLKQIEPTQDGYGKGGFVVIAAYQ